MRILFLVILLANLWAYGLGQGWLGPRPDDEGRDPRRLNQELNADHISLAPKRPG
ncbi:hypothetical protein [Bordetella hinzii]|uniref:Uncharacterized protein n=1 Tax=Bordetella hinzii TaxID=103855 RepID=A0AAN1RVH4_9BORD|nr:hypothetical protein [Bordetella hinzii]AKQ53507.1 hypothetical protein ACR54_00149 [Bordetella hinzii]AKQ58068.1 hypothetical protein ACR55_00151 [Bordetella hinzii]AZW16580.1 hypothetical protein CS347_07280 [Bordetella hinzii]KCB29455.1 hypothetical protein L543_0160 [Bordetella hinzii L60]KCB31720.1 hypothetical protein L541_0179 [Bordetella hinzii CA90 BAL1384]